MSILLARHAETVDNAARVIQLPVAPLSIRGRAQAAQLAERVAASGVSRILASDLARAVETATYVGARTGIKVELDPVLRERDFGDLRGTPYTALTIDPFGVDYVPPNGESWAVFHERVAIAWERIVSIAAQAAENLLVVTHGLVCRALAERHLALPAGESLPAQWGNASVTEVDSTPPWMVRRLNCMSHLASERQQGLGDK